MIKGSGRRREPLEPPTHFYQIIRNPKTNSFFMSNHQANQYYNLNNLIRWYDTIFSRINTSRDRIEYFESLSLLVLDI